MGGKQNPISVNSQTQCCWHEQLVLCQSYDHQMYVHLYIIHTRNIHVEMLCLVHMLTYNRQGFMYKCIAHMLTR